MTRLRSFWVVVAVATTAAGLGGCAAPPSLGVAETLRAAIEKTSLQARRFTHETRLEGSGAEGSPAVRTQLVEGFVEDDGRYKLQLSVEGTPAYEEVGYDDALAVRVFDPSMLATFLRSADAAGETVAALGQRHWVLDPAGAPDPSTAVSSPDEQVGDKAQDPALEALSALKTLLNLVNTSYFIEFNPDSLQYDAKEDPFPKPRKEGPIKRYDVQPFPLPDYDQIEGKVDGRRTLPGPEHFRKLSVYVRDGFVLEVRESVRVEHRLRELGKLLTALDVQEDVPEPDRVARVLAEVNRRRGIEAMAPVAEATKTLRILETGAAVKVALPSPTVAGDLSVLRNRGRPVPEAEDAMATGAKAER